jgi:DNA-binding response OmpR family regulator
MPKNKKSILLIEDEPLIKEMYVNMLEQENLRILEAFTTDEADRILKKEKVDLIILDIILPKEDGLAYLEKLNKRRKKFPPIIILTNLEGEEYRKKAKMLKAKDYFLKTNYRPLELLELIKQYL